jgi:hypothetical protein
MRRAIEIWGRGQIQVAGLNISLSNRHEHEAGTQALAPEQQTIWQER